MQWSTQFSRLVHLKQIIFFDSSSLDFTERSLYTHILQGIWRGKSYLIISKRRVYCIANKTKKCFLNQNVVKRSSKGGKNLLLTFECCCTCFCTCFCTGSSVCALGHAFVHFSLPLHIFAVCHHVLVAHFCMIIQLKNHCLKFSQLLLHFLILS
jgi:hypothetical protein